MQTNLLYRLKNVSSFLTLRAIICAILFCTFISGIAFYLFKINLIDLSLCLFHSITGLPCPFCGMTRAFLAIGQLNFSKAFYFHPLSLVLLAIMVIYLCYKKIPLWLKHKVWAYLFLFATVATWTLQLAIRRF